MDCAEETAALRRAVEPVAGVTGLSFDLVRGRMTVQVEGARPEEILAAARRSGLRVVPWTGQPAPAGPAPARVFLVGISGAATLAGAAAQAFGEGGIPFYALAVATGAAPVLPRALAAVRVVRPDMHLLMTIAVAGAAGIGEWFEAATVSFLFALSLVLESWSVGRARRAIAKLMELAPAEAAVLGADGAERRVPAEDVAPGSRVVVRPGERVPLDGVVRGGAGSVDESLLTGESLPVPKAAGDEVFAGSINGEGSLEIETTRTANQSTVAHVARLVESAGRKKSRSEQWVDRFARVYTPAVLALALFVLLVPPLLLGGAWGEWLYRALVLLVIACPCALVLSTPVAIVAAMASAARRGVVVKSGRFLELPARLKTVAFDKTGTLTEGEPRVVEIVPLDGHDEAELLARAAAVEARSQHPFARAIVTCAYERGVAPEAAEHVTAHHGLGAEGVLRGRPFRVGSRAWLDASGAMRERIEALSGPGRSVVLVASERHVCGLFALADAIRRGAREVVQELKSAGLRTVMLTGDHEATAAAIAKETGVDEVRAELSPEGKVDAVAQLVARGTTAMVGDGVNDAPALARADLGIAMGAAGSDVAVESADVALMTDDLTRLPWLVRHSRRTLRTIRVNVAVSLVVKACFVALTLFGPVSLWAAIAADMGVSLAVVAHSLALLRE